MSADHNYGELEIGLHRAQRGVYEVALRLTDPQSQAEVAPVRGLAEIDAEALLAALHDPDKYGRLLSAQVFADAALRQLYGKARVALERGGLMLRIRIAVEATALELHDLRWELLRDPETDAPLATSERIVLSRFMRGADWRRIRMQPRARLRALVAVAAPANLTDYRLAAIDIDGEVARATAALAGVELRVLGKAEPLTLERLIDALRAGADLVYLVCHGTLTRQLEPLLFLQREDGQAAPVKGAELARRIGELQQVPRLIVLASCESAGNEAAADASLAPLLADAGVPAVLAMQGKISMETVRLVMPHFFRELLLDGQIDRALAAARGAVRTRPDHWIPALYLRLKSGRIWYEPRLTGGESSLSQWKALCQCIHQGRFLPILGPDLDEGLFGGVRELAVRLATKHGYPNADHERGDLAKVAQFLSAERDRGFAHKAVQTELVGGLLARQQEFGGGAELPRLLDALVERRGGRGQDPYSALARLPASIYISASPETLLFKSVKAAGKSPEALICRWRATRTNTPQEPRPRQTPTPETPLVYHVFGVFGVPESLVLTEDDFFDFLISTSTYKLMPAVVRGSLTDSALIFLGFRLDDWTFRVLFRMIMNLEGSAGLRKYSHVGVQIDPDEHSLADVDRARRYLERYFGSDRGAGLSEPPISLFWGSPADFLAELAQHLEATRVEETPPVAEESTGDWF
jgi:hypothetical protein